MGAAKFYSISGTGIKVSFGIDAVEKEIQLGDLKKDSTYLFTIVATSHGC